MTMPSQQILVVDDVEDMRLLLARLLEREGLGRPLLAADAEEAFAVLARHPDIAVIVMDICMPGISGVEACRRLKADGRWRDIPVVMVTALEEQGNLSLSLLAGAVDFIHKPVRREELCARVGAALRLAAETARRKAREAELVALTEQLEAANKALEQLATVDSLTGLANRHAMGKRLEEAWRQSRRTSRPVSLLLMDIDHFKKYNDALGHQAGDQCLRQVAQLIKQQAARPFELAARYGGEEFLVVLPGSDGSQAKTVAGKILTAVRDAKIAHPASPTASHVTVSIGLATVVATAERTVEQAVHAADMALYEAKQGGRNRLAEARS